MTYSWRLLVYGAAIHRSFTQHFARLPKPAENWELMAASCPYVIIKGMQQTTRHLALASATGAARAAAAPAA